MAENFNPLELSETEFESFIAGLQSDPQSQSVAELPTQEPNPTGISVVPRSFKGGETVSPEGRRMGIRGGASLDVTTGADKWTRFKMGADENQLNQFKELAEKFGNENVDLSEDGKWIIRNQPSKYGGKTDLMVDPAGMDWGDWAEIGSQAIPMVAGALAAYAFGKKGKSGITKAMSGILAGAAETALVGAGQDAFVRWVNENEKNLPEIGLKRAKMAAADVVLGTLLAGGTKAGLKFLEGVVGAIGIQTGETTATRAGQQLLKERTGVKYPLTPGQESESKLLLRGEATAGGRLGSAGVFGEVLENQVAAENELRRVLLKLPRTMSDEQLEASLPRTDVFGESALRKLGSEAESAEAAVRSATDDLATTATKEAETLAGVNLSSPLNRTAVGGTVRERIKSDFETFKGGMRERYEDFLSRPEINKRIVSGDSIADAAKKVEEDFVPKVVKKEGAKKTIEGEIIEGGEKEVNLEEFVNSKFKTLLGGLKKMEGGRVAVKDLKNIRTSIDDAIAEGISIPGVDTASLKKLHQVLDDGITDSLKDLDPKLLQEWKGLTSDYAKGISRFDKQNIRRALVKEGERGSLGNTQLAESFIGDSPTSVDNYNALKEFLGEKSPEFLQLKQVARERALIRSKDGYTRHIDGDALKSQLKNLDPEVSQELFGANKDELLRIADILSKSKGKVDADELRRIASTGSLTAQKIKPLIDAEDARRVAYNNKLIKAAAKGTINAERIDPRDFVRYATDMPPAEAAKVIGSLSDSPELLQEMRQLAVEDLWQKVRIRAGEGKIADANLIDEAIGDKTKQETWKLIIGDDTLTDLKAFANTIRKRSSSMKEFSGASKIGGANDMSRLAMHGEVGTIEELATRALFAFIYARPARRVVTNLATSSDWSRSINAIISSEPFIRETMERFGSDAPSVMTALADFVEPIQRKDLAIQGELKDFDPTELSTEEFKEWLKNNVMQ